MAQWLDLSTDSQKAAQKLLDNEHFRSSVSRSYYAAYCAVAGLLVDEKLTYSYNRNNPDYKNMPAYIKNNLQGIEREKRESAAKTYVMLWKARTDADYRPGRSCTRDTALNAMRASQRILRDLEVV